MTELPRQQTLMTSGRLTPEFTKVGGHAIHLSIEGESCSWLRRRMCSTGGDLPLYGRLQQDISDEAGATYLDLHGRFSRDDFRDPAHLKPETAAELAELLAAMVSGWQLLEEVKNLGETGYFHVGSESGFGRLHRFVQLTRDSNAQRAPTPLLGRQEIL